MKHVSILILLFLTALFTACSDDEMGGNGKPREGILLTLTNGALANTKAPALSSTANLHHVTDVYAVLYHLNAEGTDGDFKLCKKLDWNPMDSAEYAIDKVQFHQFWFSQENEARNLPAGNYRVLCIGLDNSLPKTDKQNRIPGEQWPDSQANYHTSGATYKLPESIKGKPLSQALATLAEGKTQEDIAHSELFAGWTDFAYMPGELSEVKVEMKRRVAGVICYLTDIPYLLTYSDGSYRVTGVRLCLCQPQNKQIPLCRVESQPDAGVTTMVAADYGSEPFADGDGSEVLAEHTFYQDAGNGELKLKEGYSKHESGENIYRIENKSYNRPIKENSILMGAYLLPVERLATATGSTLMVQLMGRQIEETGTDTGSNLDANKEEIVIRTLPALNSELVDGEDESQYNIHPNYIYQIGRKPTPGLSQDEYPESLEGNRLFLRVKKWTQEEIPVEFPSVPIYATMEFDKDYSEDYIFDCMGTPWYEEYRDTYPLGKNEEIEYEKLTIIPSLSGKPWKLAVKGEGLYIKKTNNGSPVNESFTTTYTSGNYENTCKVDLLMTDYIEERDYVHDPTYKGLNIENDYRQMKLFLYTFKDSCDGEIIHIDSLSVKQYNAITVDVEHGDDIYVRAFARFDMGVTRDLSSNAYISEFTYKWGYRDVKYIQYMDLAYQSIHEYDGQDNYLSAKDFAESKLHVYNQHRGEFVVSAIRNSIRKRVEVDKENSKDAYKLRTLENAYWYLPACDELVAFLSLPKTLPVTNRVEAVKALKLNVRNNGEQEGMYWSSTPKYPNKSSDRLYSFSSSTDATASFIPGFNDENWHLTDKDEQLYIRQACHLRTK